MKLKLLPNILQNEYDRDALVFIDDGEFFYNFGIDFNIIEDLTNHDFQIYSAYYKPVIPKWQKWLVKKKEYRATIYLIGRGKLSGKQIIKVQNFLPYCYMNDPNGDYTTYLNEHVKKVIFECNPSILNQLRDKYSNSPSLNMPLEVDVPYIRRFLCDTHGSFKSNDVIQPNIGIIDIETNYPISDDIISFAINDGKNIYFNSYHLTPNYKDLLLDLWERAKSFDIITNWNVHFDMDILNKAYNEVTGENESIKDYVGLFDLGRGTVKKLYGKEIKGSWSLSNAGNQIAKTLKIDTDEKLPNELELDDLINYNCVDVIIPEEINEVLGVIESHIALNWLVQCTIEDTERTDLIDDISLLTSYHLDKKVLKSKPPYSMKPKGGEVGYEAAKPLAKNGVYNGILKFDIEQAYPTAVVAINATPETKDEGGKYVAPNGVRFNDGYSTFIKALQNLLKQKAMIKQKLKESRIQNGFNNSKTKQLEYIYFAIKTQTAAFSHGEFGYWQSRVKDYDVAGAITTTAKDFIFFIMNKCDEIGYTWIYQHTDSVFINAPLEKKDEIIQYLNKLGNDYCKEKGYAINFNLEFEKFYPLGYIHAPARNVLVPNIDKINDYPLDPDAWEVTGMNFMRAETPYELADIEIELIKRKMLKFPDNLLIDYLKQRIKNLNNVSDTDLGIIKPLNKPIGEYGGKRKDGGKCPIPYHIKALTKAQEEYDIEIKEGEKFMIIPIITNQIKGVRKLKREKVEIAFPISQGLPSQYKIDFEFYLIGNLIGKIYKLFDIPKTDLIKHIYDVIPNIEITNEILTTANELIGSKKK
jgi:DNA polymerase elongation subunit (family B)